MPQVPLARRRGHLFFDIDDQAWLVDTGAPISFGSVPILRLAGQSFPVAACYGTFTPDKLSRFVGERCTGLVGVDVLNQFDIQFDLPQQRAELVTGELELGDAAIPIEPYEGIPIIDVGIATANVRMIFDAGARYSYWQDDSLAGFHEIGPAKDFHPSLPESFVTVLHRVDMRIGSIAVSLQTGKLPGPLTPLLVANTSGIVGNEALIDHVVIYAPRRDRIEFRRAS